jgi:NAD(P)-dependent dehydrogenase (short-subunit alcohol dehydrogenase family)
MDLKDKGALIADGTSGMGSAVALAMAEKGASVVITDRDETRGASTMEQIHAGGHEAQFLAADFSEMSEVGRVKSRRDRPTSFDRRPDSVVPLVVGSGGRLRRYRRDLPRPHPASSDRGEDGGCR